MKRVLLAGLVTASLVFSIAVRTQELPKMPGPEKEHEWLQQLVGEWETDAEATMAPGAPPMKCKGTDSTRSLGGLWVVAEGSSTVMEMPVKSVMILGYDPQKKKYVGTWVDSVMNHMWRYEGTVDGNKLTLATEGPNPMLPGKTCKYREVIEVKSKDHRTFTSSMQGDDGKWVTFMTANYRRKK